MGLFPAYPLKIVMNYELLLLDCFMSLTSFYKQNCISISQLDNNIQGNGNPIQVFAQKIKQTKNYKMKKMKPILQTILDQIIKLDGISNDNII